MQLNSQYLGLCLGLCCPLYRRFVLFAAISFVFLTACTDKKPEVPHVLELHAIPKSITISDKYFYPKPFSIRAKYSDKTEKSINARVLWISENSALISINKKGELQKNGECLQKKCVVSLIATDTESGKSIRLTVNVNQKKQQNQKISVNDKKKGPVSKKNENTELEIVADESNIEEINVEEEVLEEKTVSAINDIQFSPQVNISKNNTSENKVLDELGNESEPVSENNEVSAEKEISKIIFNKENIELTSGEHYRADIVVLDFDDKPVENFNIDFGCFVAGDFNSNIVVLPDCQIIAIKPGDISLQIRVNDEKYLNIQNETRLNVRINPVLVNSSVIGSGKGFNTQINLSENEFQIWYRIINLDNFLYYKAKLSANVRQGLRLTVFTRSVLNYPTCLNTMPTNFNYVSCYFQTGDNDVTLVVENILNQSVRANLSLLPESTDLFQNYQPLKQSSPEQLKINEPISTFIFANESGGNNKHYYVFDTADLINNVAKKSLIIRLSDFSSLIKLSVSWVDGYCNENLMQVNANEIVCRVPIDVAGKLQLQLDGNNGETGILNGPAAGEGGTFYKLSVIYAQ